MSFELNVHLDPDSLERLAAFDNYQTVLDPALQKAMDASTSMLQAFASDYMDAYFENPTGQLSGSVQSATDSPDAGRVWTELPYGTRRNYGFSGKTDALGRYYPNDPGIMWAEQTVTLEQYKVQDQFQAAIDFANTQLGRGTP